MQEFLEWCAFLLFVGFCAGFGVGLVTGYGYAPLIDGKDGDCEQ